MISSLLTLAAVVNVPDSGVTAVLFGAALVATGLVARFFKK